MEIKRHMPIADQVTLVLHKRIIDGLYLPGERLPSEQVLAKELTISRGTVRSALASLASQGLIIRKQGDGTYVSQVSGKHNSLMHLIWEYAHLIEASGRKPSISGIAFQKRHPNRTEAQALEIGEDKEVVLVERLFYADDKPIIMSTNISPVSLFNLEIDKLDAGLGIHEFLKKYCDKEIASADVNVSPILPNEKVREELSLDVNVPVLQFEEIFRDINRVPLVFAINYYSDKKLSLQGVRPWYSIGNT